MPGGCGAVCEGTPGTHVGEDWRALAARFAGGRCLMACRCTGSTRPGPQGVQRTCEGARAPSGALERLQVCAARTVVHASWPRLTAALLEVLADAVR